MTSVTLAESLVFVKLKYNLPYLSFKLLVDWLDCYQFREVEESKLTRELQAAVLLLEFQRPEKFSCDLSATSRSHYQLLMLDRFLTRESQLRVAAKLEELLP